MIKYLTRNQIDIDKYDSCISKSINSRIYAHSWYLNAVCNDWDALILGDYTTVMPLPKRKKYGVNYIYQAPWIQQLGLFSKNKIESNLCEEFIQKIPRKFKLIDIMLNTSNGFSSKHITPRDNFVLSLENKNHKSLQKGYSKGRKSSIKQAQKHGLCIRTTTTANTLIELFKENKGTTVKKTEHEYSALSNLVLKGLQLGKIFVYEVLNKKGKLIGGAVFLKDTNRITYLFSALNDEGREKQAMSYLMDFIIIKYANQSIILDFEGSMILDIASFYKSFGAEKEMYFHYKKYRLY
ncbi:peptidoglycan bridge formation glycyltransferase FemA/FemB family protein [Aureibaculum sp. 2210JD6-5]|uniref:peptidoglycan bridge formation glycyltransferase FemA/FemB family protein n=1 Tax=Aureibaculum sp. 2210JD6-5 TaxID=3103957 RepID=UPI002AAD5DA2|nr:peptidoglycan bridge formation glycyltransferase FemA/FemB family protein [Aureibaculum sp. 2210JD6-5]MDY7394420.1 peptidoglycan bridge formation glycyltransferase FemA/FemB family protein [Aureibaculum sp. 2210JD6-5]